ncbi:MAG: hypothetical protein PHV11_06310 [Candidatus Bipolaricaulis sp.]|nr:hypothetical protein [Candidatus Bipolaricaulis sp.]
MAVLENITISDAVLESLKPDVATLLFEGQDDFSTFIERVKEEIYGQIKIREEENYDGYTDAEIDTALDSVSDYTNEKYLQKRIGCLVISELFLAHGDTESAGAWRAKAEAIPFRYYIDSDSDSAADDAEQRYQASVRLGR